MKNLDHYVRVKKKSTLEKLKEGWQVRIMGLSLEEWASKLSKIEADIYFQAEHTGTLFKLLFLWSYLIHPYLVIIANRRANHKSGKAIMFYADPYAGSGLCKLSTKSNNVIPILGSSLLALLAPFRMHEKNPNVKYSYLWDYMFLNEIDENCRKALKKRLQYVLECYKHHHVSAPYHISENLRKNESRSIIITNYDCTKVQYWEIFRNSLLESLNWKVDWIHGLLFIDPPTPSKINLAGFIKLLEVPSDVIILLHDGLFAEIIKRGWYKGMEKDLTYALTMRGSEEIDFNELRKMKLEDISSYYVKVYESALKETKIKGIKDGSETRSEIIKFSIRTKRRHYTLLLGVRKTRGKQFNRWFNWAKDLSEEMSRLSELGEIIVDAFFAKKQHVF